MAEGALGTTGADLRKPGGRGLPPGPGRPRLAGRPPGRPPGRAPPKFELVMGEPAPWRPSLDWPGLGDCVERGGRPMRCCCRARAFCMRSTGRLPALGGGLLAVLRVPQREELGLIWLCWGSEMVRREGTRRWRSGEVGELEVAGDIGSEEPGGSRGVVAGDESSTRPGGERMLGGKGSSSGVMGIVPISRSAIASEMYDRGKTDGIRILMK